MVSLKPSSSTSTSATPLSLTSLSNACTLSRSMTGRAGGMERDERTTRLRRRERASVGADAGEVLAGLGVDADEVALVDEERDVDGGAALELGGLGGAGGGVPLDAGLGLRDGEFDLARDLDGERFARSGLDEKVHLAALFDEASPLDAARRERGLLVGLRVHQVQAELVLVEELVLVALDAGLLDLLTRAERVVDDLAVADILQLRPDERAALAGLDVEKLDDLPDIAVPDEGEAVAEVLRGGHRAWAGEGEVERTRRARRPEIYPAPLSTVNRFPY